MTLTERNLQVARLIAEGRTDKQIAAALGVSRSRISQIVAHLGGAWQLDCAGNLRVQIAQRVARSRSED